MHLNPSHYAKTKDHVYQSSDYLKYALGRLIGSGIFFELRIRDLLSLRWEPLLNEDNKFVIHEKKTTMRRTI